MYTGLEGMLQPFMSLTLIGWIGGGTLVGLYVGAIPGLSVTMAVSLLISFTFSWEVLPALAVMVGIFVGGVYGGARAGILLNIPGAPAAVASTFDGFPLAKMGLAGQAMGLSTTQAVIGNFFGIVVLALFAPLISHLALIFQARDFFLLAFMGLFLVGSLAEGNMIKALIAAFMGIVIGLIGMDPETGQGRMNFGTLNLLGGIHFVVIMIGTFGISEALVQLQTKAVPVKQNISRITPEWSVVLDNMFLTLRASTIGVVVGALPGTGGDIAALMAYDHARRTVKNPYPAAFGHGAYQGLIAPEAAANAAIGGAFVPMMTLGIPGDSVTAVLIGALIIHGLRPGPMLMREQPEFFWFVVGALLIANVFLYVWGMTGIRAFSKIVEIPKPYIIPIIVVLTFVGGYSIQNSITDIYWMIAFGILGYFMKRYGYPVAPLVLGVILTPIIDENFRRGVQLSHGSIAGFFEGMFGSAVSLSILVIMLLTALVSSPRLMNALRRALGGKSA
ncbi:MAG: tripartite tricarboxylate transporter permease [Candidatus Accumulibacter sp.]|jgi:putative tricarboxylic transport membrane protein|nr:tripartite tricarboxylate transporter permease [Accumulibacter sp.]